MRILFILGLILGYMFTLLRRDCLAPLQDAVFDSIYDSSLHSLELTSAGRIAYNPDVPIEQCDDVFTTMFPPTTRRRSRALDDSTESRGALAKPSPVQCGGSYISGCVMCKSVGGTIPKCDTSNDVTLCCYTHQAQYYYKSKQQVGNRRGDKDGWCGYNGYNGADKMPLYWNGTSSPAIYLIGNTFANGEEVRSARSLCFNLPPVDTTGNFCQNLPSDNNKYTLPINKYCLCDYGLIPDATSQRCQKGLQKSKRFTCNGRMTTLNDKAFVCLP